MRVPSLITAVTGVAATALIVGLVAAPPAPTVQPGDDVSLGSAADTSSEDYRNLTVDEPDDADERLPLNGTLTETKPTVVPSPAGGSGWTRISRLTTLDVTVGGVGSVPADAFGAHLKITARWTAKKDLGVLEIRDPELAGDYTIIERPFVESEFVVTDDVSTTLSTDGAIEIVNHSRTDIDVRVEVLGWYDDPDADAEVGTGVEEGFELIEQIPDSETTTQADIDAWLEEQGLERDGTASEPGTDDALQADFDPRTDATAITVGAGACATAIIAAVLSNIFLPAKLKKVKAAIKAVGGTKKAYKALRKAYKTYRKKGHGRSKAAKKAFKKVFNRSDISESTQKTLIELASLGPVAGACF